MAEPYPSIEELLADEGFLAWYFGTDEVEVARWTRWICASDEHAELARQAYDFLQSLEVEDRTVVTEEDIARLWARIQARIRAEESKEPPPTAG
jgi:hypothetical protein